MPAQKRSPLKQPNELMGNIELPERLSTKTDKMLNPSESDGKLSSQSKKSNKYNKMHVELSSKRETLLNK